MIEGIGPNAEIITNKKGGKQSKPIGALHLVDPEFLYGFFDTYCQFVNPVIMYMLGNITKDEMVNRIFYNRIDRFDTLIKVAETLEYGASRYSVNNWRLIPEEDHINHALAHLLALEAGDTQDDHLSHFYTRIMMAYATNTSSNMGSTYIEVKDNDKDS